MEIFAYIVSELLIHGFRSVSFRFTHTRGFILGFKSHLRRGSNPGRIESFFFNEKLRSSFVCVFSDSLSRTKSFLPARMPILKRFENRSEIIIARCLTKGFWRSRGSVRKTLLGCPHPLCICITIQPLLCIIILKCSINEGQLPEGTMPLGLSSKIQNGSGEIKRYWEVLLRAPRGREKANPCWIFRNSIMMTTKKRKIVCEIYM